MLYSLYSLVITHKSAVTFRPINLTTEITEEQGLEGITQVSDGTGPYKCTKGELDGAIVLEAYDDAVAIW
jgi:hypothetical protein